MKIAIPVAGEKLCMHFGHCERFALIDVDENTKKIISEEYVDAPPHEPGLLPAWLAEKGAGCIIAGGMGSRAQGLFTQSNIKVVVGAPSDVPAKVVQDFLDNNLVSGDNACDH